MKITIVLLLSCFLFDSCKQNDANNSINSAAPYKKMSELKSFYKQFRGTIGTQPITMNLTKMTVVDDSSYSSFSGYFYYDKEEKPIPIYGMTDEKGNIKLDVSGSDGDTDNNSSSFNGKQNADGLFAGTWTDTDSSELKSSPFTLHETYDNHAVRFNYSILADSAVLFKGRKDSPKALFSEGVLTPVFLTDKKIADFLNKTFLTADIPSYNLSDTVTVKNAPKITYPDANARFKAESTTYLKDYLETLKDEKPEAEYNLNYSNASTINIFYNNDNLLSIGETIDTYTGGAHGMTITTLSSYDLKTQKKLSLDEIFKPGYQSTVTALLDKAVRIQQNIKADEPLNSVLFTDKMDITENFCLTRKGILFLYNSDEIASHAQGEIQLFIPFSDLKAVLK